MLRRYAYDRRHRAADASRHRAFLAGFEQLSISLSEWSFIPSRDVRDPSLDFRLGRPAKLLRLDDAAQQVARRMATRRMPPRAFDEHIRRVFFQPLPNPGPSSASFPSNIDFHPPRSRRTLNGNGAPRIAARLPCRRASVLERCQTSHAESRVSCACKRYLGNSLK